MQSNSSEKVTPDLDDFLRCGRCGFCLAGCPVYCETAVEGDSPRGRVALIRALAEGRLEPGKNYTKHIFNCTDCMACVEACPSGVKVNEFVLNAKSKIEPKPSRLQSLVLDKVVSSPDSLKLFGNALRLYQNSGLRRAVRSAGTIIPDCLVKLEYMLPKIPAKVFDAGSGIVIPAEGQRKYRVGYFVGCAQSFIFTSVARATTGILTQNSCEVIIPAGWKCCGMPHVGYGEVEEARRLARGNIDAFGAAEVEVIITDCATCGSMLKKYGNLLANDPEYSKLAIAFSKKVRDLSEFLAGDISLNSNFNVIKGKFTYHDPCHLARGQAIKSQPREIMASLLGDNLIEMKQSDRCCGGAGTYNISHYETSMGILEHKISSIEATQADTVITACPGCQIQIGLGIQKYGLDVRVVHLAELLHQAYETSK